MATITKTRPAPYRGAALVARARSLHGSSHFHEMCQSFVIWSTGTMSSGDYDHNGHAAALDAWKKAKALGKVMEYGKDFHHLSEVPAGYPAYFTGGSHLFGHTGITSGGDRFVSTDAPKWGINGEVPISWIPTHWGNGLKFVGYVLIDGNGYDFRSTAVHPKPEVDELWFKHLQVNLALYNRSQYGQDHWKINKVKFFDYVATKKPHTIALQEASHAIMDDLAANLKKQGIERVPCGKDGGKGREILVRSKDVKILHSGLRELTPLYQKDTKEAAWAHLEIVGSDAFMSSYHLESDTGTEPDNIRLKQMQSLVKFQLAQGTTYGLPDLSRHIFSGDGNSENMVPNWMTEEKFPSTKVQAHVVKNAVYSTLNSWLPAHKGDWIDYTYVHQDRPVLVHNNDISQEFSDHFPQVINIGRIKK